MDNRQRRTKSFCPLCLLTPAVLLLVCIFGYRYTRLLGERRSAIACEKTRLETCAQLIDGTDGSDTLQALLSGLPDDLEVILIDSTLRITYATHADLSEEKRQLSPDDHAELRLVRYAGTITDEERHADGSATLRHLRYSDGLYTCVTTPCSTSPGAAETTALVLLLLSSAGLVALLVSYCHYRNRRSESFDRLHLLTDLLRESKPTEEVTFSDRQVGEVAESLRELVGEKERKRKQMDEALHHLINLFDLSKIGVALFDAAGTTRFTNAHFIQYASMISSETLTPENLGKLLEEEGMRPIADFLASEPGKEESRTARIVSGSHTFEVKALRFTPYTYDLSIEDVTILEQTSQLKREMTSNITHEIRTPLTSIRGYLETLRYTDLTPEQRLSFTDKAYRQAERLSEMMDDIRLISQMDEKDPSEYRMEDLNLNLMVEEVRAAHTGELQRSGDTFINRIPDGLMLRANYSLIHSVIQNLVENSLHYAGPGVTLCFSCYHQDESYLYLSYYDTGRGVPDETLGRIFERFYRIDAGRTRSQGGSGLGLSIVRNAIRRHGGQIQARRHSPEGGLEFLFTLHK